MKTSMEHHYLIVGIKQRKPCKILYWQAWFGNTLIDQHQNVAILRAKFGDSCTYKAIR